MLCLLALVAEALAVDPETDANVPRTEKTLSEYLSDLSNDDDNKRLFAARVVRGRLRHDLRVLERAREGSLAYDDARLELVELESRIPGSCIVALSYPNTVALCADMLAWLEVSDARPALEEALARETRRGVRPRIEAALAEIPTVATPATP